MSLEQAIINLTDEIRALITALDDNTRIKANTYSDKPTKPVPHNSDETEEEPSLKEKERFYADKKLAKERAEKFIEQFGKREFNKILKMFHLKFVDDFSMEDWQNGHIGDFLAALQEETEIKATEKENQQDEKAGEQEDLPKLETVKKELMAFSKKFGKDKARKVLAAFQAKKISDLKPKQYRNVLTHIDEMTNELSD